MARRSKVVVFGSMAFRANDLNLLAWLDGGLRKRAYILSLICRYHPRYSLNDMTFNLELVVIRITFLNVSFDSLERLGSLHDRPKSFSQEARLPHYQDQHPVTYLDLDRDRHL